MLLDQDLSETEVKIARERILRLETNRIRSFSILLQAVFCVGVLSVLLVEMIPFSWSAFTWALSYLFFLQILFFLLVGCLTTLINIIPYKDFDYGERYLRMFWICMIAIHLLIIGFLGLIFINEIGF